MFGLRRSDRELLAQSEKQSDRLVLRLIGSPRRLLATLLIGNESVNVAISAVMAGFIGRFYNSGNEIQDGLIATFLALPLLLVFGEIGPKTVAYSASLSWARRSARPIWIFGALVTPIRLVVRAIAELALRPFSHVGVAHGGGEVSEEEFRVMVDAGSAEGEVDDRERRLIHKVFEFGDKTVAQAMQSRRKVFALAYGLPMARLHSEIAARGYSRVPIYDTSIDNIRGVLYAKDLVISSRESKPPEKLADLLHDPLFVPQTTPLERLLAMFKKGKTHMALVVNEYGTLVGIVTMEDLLEELFGEIKDERELQQSMASKLRSPTEPYVPLQAKAKEVK
jgi:putative hemolysin